MASAAMTRPQAARSGGAERATPLPAVLGICSLAISAAAVIVVLAQFSARVTLFGVPLPLVSADAWWISLLGYVFALGVIPFYGWDLIAQRRGLTRNPNFQDLEWAAKALRHMLIWVILLCLWHALNLSVPLSEVIGVGA